MSIDGPADLNYGADAPLREESEMNTRPEPKAQTNVQVGSWVVANHGVDVKREGDMA